MFPTLDLNTVASQISTATEKENSTELGRVYLFDFDKGEYVLRDGKMVEADYEQAIRQWIVMLITTELNHYNIYKGTDFGLKLRQFVGRKDIPMGVISSEIKRQIEEKIIMHPQITGIQDFRARRDNRGIIISFEVLTQKNIVVKSEVNLVV